MQEYKVVDAIKEYVDRLITQRTPTAYLGVWIAAESVDSNLSQVTVQGNTWRFVPKLESVTGLVGKDKVLMIKFPGLPATIHGVVLGDVTLATI